MDNYSEFYTTLGVTPDTDWKTLRANYRRLIGRWHPDRFLADATRKELAEEHCRQITLAYQALRKYRREHGVLPLVVSESAIAETRSQKHGFGSMSDYPRPDSLADRTTEETADKMHAKRRPERRHHKTIALAVLVAATYLYLVDRDPDVATPRDNQATRPNPGTSTQSLSGGQNPSDLGGISIGSTLGEVYSIQGVPTLTQDDTWYYGKSQIRFYQGKVISWKEHPDNPLRITRN
jgi:hypothetical protein